MRKRQIRVEVRFTKEEYASFMRNVKRSGLNRESYLRALAEGCIPREAPPIDFLGLMKELHAIGNNLRQIAARANATGFFMVEELRGYVQKLFDVTDRIEAKMTEADKIYGDDEDLGG